MEKFLIIKFSALGDIIHTIPAFSALRKRFPEAEIIWVVKKNGKEILDLVPGIDRLVIDHTREFGKNLRKITLDFFRLYKEFKERNQIALDFQGLMKSGFLAFLSRAEKRIGFHKNNLREPLASVFYTDTLEEIPENNHVIRKNLKLLTVIGIHEEQLEFPLLFPEHLTESVWVKLKNIGYDGRKKLILFNIGANWETKRWAPEKWVLLAKLMKRGDFFPVILWGNEEEKSLALKIHYDTHIPLSPSFSIKEVMGLMREASLLISGDTFALHAACALSVPVVGIYGPTLPQRNGPFNTKARVMVHEIECSFCRKRHCESVECLKNISPSEVAESAFQLL